MRSIGNKNTMIYSNGTLWGEANSYTSESKEAYEIDGEHKGDTARPFVKSEGGDAPSWISSPTNFSASDEHGSRDSSGAEYRSELSRKPSIGRNTNSSLYVFSERKKGQNSLDNMNSSKPNSSIQPDVASYSDKRVLECDTSDSVDSREGMTKHVLKDICVDEVDPVDKFSVGSSKNDQSSTFIPNSSDTFRYGSTEGGSDVEPSVSYRSPGLAYESSSTDDDANGQLNAQESSKSELTNSFGHDAPKFHGSVNPVLEHESNIETAAKKVSDVPRNDPFVGSKLPSQGYGTPRIFRSFLTSFIDEGAKIPSEISALPVAGLSADEQTDRSPDFTPSTYSSNGNGENVIHRSGPQQSPGKDGKPRDAVSPDGVSQHVSSKNTDGQAKHEKDNSLNDAVLYQGKYDEGETSFSKANLVAYIEPIPQPGNISMRSDGSISGRSFAFPILQSEWNSSPVKMAKADRRHYRKHRGWRSGIFCCRF